MYFKKLEIAGFKSFAEKTLLHFEPGITAIVGPNGCGKSNIFDSMRWCLGEQSIKSLRGAKMEDVIFNGTENVPAQNMAEVSLTISNEAKILPIDYDEVTITRRLFRSGESEYLINNNIVRLKDINELLMGTGIGAESYSLVEQGKIDLVISSKPEDRRLVFDEATGVSKYKVKKKEAMRKLEETDNNLLRINDIITEVKRQIGSIERQASKARRYKEVFEKLKSSELTYAGLELKAVKGELAVTAEMAKKSSEEEAQLNAELQTLDGRLIHQQQGLQELDARIAEMKEDISVLENTNASHRQHISLNLDRTADLDKRIQILTAQEQQFAAKIASHQSNISDLTGQLTHLNEIFSAKDAQLKEQEIKLAGLEADIGRLQAENKDLKNRIFELNLTESKTSNLLNENSSTLHGLLARQRRLETEKLKTEEENAELLKHIEAVGSEIAQERSRIEATHTRLADAKAQQAALENILKEMDVRLRGLENEKLSLRSQIEFLKELRLKYESMPEAQQGILEIQGDIPKNKISDIIAHAREVAMDDKARVTRITCDVKFIPFDLDGLERRITDIDAEMQALRGEMSGKEKELIRTVENGRSIEEELQQERFTLTNKEAVNTNLNENARKIHDELSVIALETNEVNEGLKQARSRDEQYRNDLNMIASDLSSCENTITQNSNAAAAQSQERETILVGITQLKADLGNQKAKEEGLSANLKYFQDTLTQDEHSLTLTRQEITESKEKIHQLEEESGTLEFKIKVNEEEIGRKTQEHRSQSQMRIEEVNSIDFIQKQIIDLEEKMDRVKEAVHRHQMQEQELHFKLTNIKNRMLSAYNVDVDETPAAGPESDAGVDIKVLQEEIQALREKAESFGTVNLVAIEELEELKNRHDFLTQQQNDLLTAKESLKNAILKINRNTRKMFLETFQIVAEEFKNYFRLLFGGGEAKLFLIDEEDVLESGIEIICRPPGKKLQNITLLSGGEKSLSAIALIFAIFKTKPSPFCVLDEIDAALDESNIDRFSRMLGDFAKTSQFIVITHNKKTISRANVMYGITMERSGMSKIVSVKLHENSTAKNSAGNQASPDETPVARVVAVSPQPGPETTLENK
ncbi:MAG: AAA family ATPase [Candidatus Omnitrophica bacterium]|nr:AAA family ATPase [Candidatus Omnitrophota bacterium]